MSFRTSRRSDPVKARPAGDASRLPLAGTPGDAVPNDARPAVDATTFRTTLSHFATGVTLITGLHEGHPVGFTCQSFVSVSLSPPLVSFSVMRGSETYARLQRRGSFTVNVLASHHEAISDRFSRRGRTGWGGTPWERAPSGNPVISDALVWIDCEIHGQHDAGDHLIVIGQVIDLGVNDPDARDALVYFRGSYRSLVPQTDVAG